MKNNNILISVVTVVYNGEKVLEQTIQSIINQTYKNIEYIVIDGGSTDNTLCIIKKYQKQISYIVSEKDNGLYDAMNKSLKLASGDFINFMNAGDIFNDYYVIENIVSKIINKKKVYFARAKIVDKNLSWLYPNNIYKNQNISVWLKKALPNHQTMFFPKEFYENYKYNLRYKIGADSDYKFKAKKDFGFIFIDIVACKFELGGVSSNFNDFKKTQQIIKDSWEISMKYEGLFYAIDRFIKIFTKYILNKVLGSFIFLQLHCKLKG